MARVTDRWEDASGVVNVRVTDETLAGGARPYSKASLPDYIKRMAGEAIWGLRWDHIYDGADKALVVNVALSSRCTDRDLAAGHFYFYEMR